MNETGSVMVEALNRPPVVGYLHEPEGTATAGLVLTHGAGANCGSALLVNLAEAFAKAGWAVLRCDLAFRQKRKSGPPFPAQAGADRDSLRAALRELRSRVQGQVYLGGHSYGGRQASMVAAEDKGDVPGLLLLSYPLHPPDKPQQLRTAHFGDIQAPCLFVQGTSDPFGTPEEINTAISQIKSRTRALYLDRAGHDLGKGKLEAVNKISEEFRTFVLS